MSETAKRDDHWTPRMAREEVLAAMREWISDCVWGDLDEDDVAQLSDAEVIRGVERHYEGGVAWFLLAM